MPSQNDITINVRIDKDKISGFDVTKGEKVDSKDYASFVNSYFDYQARVDMEKQKTEQEKEKAKQNKFQMTIILLAVIVIAYCIYFLSDSQEVRQNKIDANKTIELERMRIEANKTK